MRYRGCRFFGCRSDYIAFTLERVYDNEGIRGDMGENLMDGCDGMI